MTVEILTGDCIDVLNTLPEKSVHCCVTSPPYFGLRDYGTATWEGGDPECDHRRPWTDNEQDSSSTLNGRASNQNHEREPWVTNTGICKGSGAKRIDKQIGLESTPDEFVAKMVDVFRAVRRVMRDDAVAWCNLGDSYSSGSKNLLGIPWRVALALQADGWVLRQDIIWAKNNPMPESVTDRCTKSHEYIFLLTKRPKYFYDHEAIKEKATYAGQSRGGSTNRYEQNAAGMDNREYAMRNKRSVWHVNPAAFKGCHFATFPPKLIEPCILAGTSAKGCCPACGAP